MLPSLVLDTLNNVESKYFSKVTQHDFVTWTELERLLNLRPFVNYKRFHVVNDKEYSWFNPGWASDNSYPPSLIQEEIKNYVCYLSDCSKVNEQVNALCKQIEEVTDSEVDAHIYFSFFYNDRDIEKYIHKEKSNNLIIQLDGKTEFWIWGLERSSEPLLKVIMHPGDVLYIPAGHWHGALSLTKRLSLSIPISPHRVLQKEDRHWIRLE